MNANQATAADTASNENTSDEFSTLEANNFIRGNGGACLIITNNNHQEPIETVFITVNRSYFRINQFGRKKADRVASVQRHTMSTALRDARKNGHDVQLAAYRQSAIDISSHIDFIRQEFELDDKDSNAGSGLSRDDLDQAETDEHLETAAAPVDSSAEHGGGW